jgi:Sugar-specific transcriptional regulator TrmB
MLTVLGLGAAEEIVYRQLVSCARATAADLAAATGQPVAAVTSTLDGLVARGLAVTDPAGTATAAPPAVALGALVRQSATTCGRPSGSWSGSSTSIGRPRSRCRRAVSPR